jgi:hypothetical protein
MSARGFSYLSRGNNDGVIVIEKEESPRRAVFSIIEMSFVIGYLLKIRAIDHNKDCNLFQEI